MKLLVSMVAYRERQLERSVRSCYENAENPQDLMFSIVSEQYSEDMHADLSFIPENQIIYKKYDLSEFRGVLWSRAKTMENNFDYDHVLATCGHNLYTKNWDTVSLRELQKAKNKTNDNKAILAFCGPEFEYNQDYSLNIDHVSTGRTSNYYHKKFDGDVYVPGHGWPDVVKVPKDGDVHECVYLQASYIFGERQYFDELPFEPNIGYQAEEIYMTIKTWAAGWKMFATSEVVYLHDTGKRYPDNNFEMLAWTRRPWLDINKVAYWKQSDESMILLNKLLSGKAEVPLNKVLEYCEFSGMDKKWCEYMPDFDKMDNEIGIRIAFDRREEDPIIVAI
jgi:hypothetical protein